MLNGSGSYIGTDSSSDSCNGFGDCNGCSCVSGGEFLLSRYVIAWFSEPARLICSSVKSMALGSNIFRVD